MHFKLRSIAEHVVEIYFPEVSAAVAHLNVMKLHQWLNLHRFEGLIEVVPCISTVTVIFDFFTVKKAALDATCLQFISQLIEAVNDQELVYKKDLQIKEIPVRYDGEDMVYLAEALGLTVEKIIEIHSNPVYEVLMMGFLPGFPYLSGLDERIHFPRKSVPSMKVKAGSVAIGGGQTGIYPLDSPGGWHVIGHTDMKLFTPKFVGSSEPFTLLKAGDQLKFIPL